MTLLVLDIKTVPDPQIAQRLLALEAFSDAEATLAMKTLRVAQGQGPQQPPQLRRIVAMALVRADAERFDVCSFSAHADERAALIALEDRVREASSPLHAWDTARPSLLARALAHDLCLPALLAGDGPISLAGQFGFSPHTAPLAELAAAHGLPQRLGLCAIDAEAAHAAGDNPRLLAGSAVDALIAYLLMLALQAATGARSASLLAAERARVRAWLAQQQAPHWQAFFQQWKSHPMVRNGS